MSFKIPFWKRFVSWIFPINIETKSSKISGKLELNLQYGLLVIDSPLANYSFGSLHSIFQETIQTLNLSRSKDYNVLILGFGGGSIANILLNEFYLKCRITGVELDEEIINLSKSYYNSNIYNNTQVIIEDAFIFMEKNKIQYDLVFVDLFIDTQIPEKFQKTSFLNLLKNSLKKETIICMNSMSNAEKLKTNWKKVFLNNNGISIQENFIFIHKNN